MLLIGAGRRPPARLSVSRRNRSGGTRPLRRFQVRSQRASPAASSWSQLSLPGIAAGSAGAARSPGVLAPWGVGSPPPGGPTGGQWPVPRGWIPDGPHRRPPAPRQHAPPPLPGLLRCRVPGGGGAWRRGRATETSLPVPGGCGWPPPDLPAGWRRAPRATPASLSLCGTCLHIGGILWVPWPLLPEGAVLICGWSFLTLGRRAGWPVESFAAPARGWRPTRRGPSLRARVRGLRRCRAARPFVTTFASAWRRFGGRACPSTGDHARPGASGTLWSGLPAGQTPGFAALALSLRRAWSRRARWLPSRRTLTITRAQSATQILRPQAPAGVRGRRRRYVHPPG